MMMSGPLLAVTLLVISSDAYNPNGVRKHTHMARHYIRPTTEFFSTEDLFSKPITAKDFDESSVRKFRRKLETFRDAGEFVSESFGDRIQKRTYKIDPYGWEQQKQVAARKPKLLYYDVLGLDSEATASEIKRSYRHMAKLFHPDANPHKDTTAHFTLLNRAYEVLTNPRLKQRYDRYGRRGIGTSAASDVIHANGIPPIQKKSYPAYQVAKSDSADVCWKGGTSRILDLQPKRSQTTLFQAMNKNLIPPAAAPIRSRKPIRDLYSILGVQRQACQDEIRQAYMSLRQLFDPDTDKSKEVYVRFHEVTRAYEILKNHDWRTKYDKYGFRALDNIRTMEERISRPTDMDPDSPYSPTHGPHYTLSGLVSNETTTTAVAEGPVVPSSTKTVVATRPDANYEGASWMTTSRSAEEESGTKVYRVYRQIDPLPIEDTYSFHSAHRGPIPIIEIYDDEEEWDDGPTSPIILPPSSSANNFEDDVISNDDVFHKEIPFPNLSGGPTRKMDVSTTPSSAAFSSIPNNSRRNDSLPTTATTAVVATKPSAAYQSKTNSKQSTITTPVQPVSNDNVETSKVYRVYQQIDPLPLDQTYSFKPVAKATIPIIEICLDPNDDDEEWNDESSEPIMLPPAYKSTVAAKPRSQVPVATNTQTMTTPLMLSRRTPINATPTLKAPKVQTPTIKPSIIDKNSKVSVPPPPKMDEPPRWSSYSYTKSSLQGRSVEAIIRSPNLSSNVKSAAPSTSTPQPEHAKPRQSKPDVTTASRKAVVATRPSAAYQTKANLKQSLSTAMQTVSNGDEANKVYRVYRQIDPLPLDQTYSFRPVAKAIIPIIEIKLDPNDDDEEWNVESSELIMLPPSSKSSTAAKRQNQDPITMNARTTSTRPPISRRTPINATPTLVAPKMERTSQSTKTSASDKEDSKLSVPPRPKMDEPPRWSSYSYNKASLQGRSVEPIVGSPNLPSNTKKKVALKIPNSQPERANPPHRKPDVVAASRKAVVATRPSAAYQSKANSKQPSITTLVQPVCNGDETNRVYRVYRQIDPLPLDQTYNFKPVAKATIPIIEVHLDPADEIEEWNEKSSEPIMLPPPLQSSASVKPQNQPSIATNTKTLSTPPVMSRRAPINASPTMLAHIVNRSSNSIATLVAKQHDSGSPSSRSDKTEQAQDVVANNLTSDVHQVQSIDDTLHNASDLSPLSKVEQNHEADAKPKSKDRKGAPFFAKVTEANTPTKPINTKVASTIRFAVAKPDQENFSNRQRNLADEAIPEMKHGATVENKNVKQDSQHSPRGRIPSRANVADEVSTSEIRDDNKGNSADHTSIGTVIGHVGGPSDSDTSAKEMTSSQASTDMNPPVVDQEFTKVRTIPRQIDPLPIDETFGPKGTITARRALAHATSVLLTSDQDRSPSRYTLASHNAPDGLLGVKLAAILGVNAPGRTQKSTSPTGSRRPVTQLKATRQQIPDKTSAQSKISSSLREEITQNEKTATEMDIRNTLPLPGGTPFSSRKHIVDS